jgi:NAD-dependent deacetylase
MSSDTATPLEDVAVRLRAARRVVALTGAGVSAESGVPTFRGSSGEGLWEKFRPEDLANPDAFAREPELVWRWYAWRRELVAGCRPNPAHDALAALERRVPEFLLVTQNVDGLHASAGSQRIAELHGSLWRTRCLGCGAIAEDRRVPLPELPPRCGCGGLLRPDIVWFGESLPEAELVRGFETAAVAEVVLVIGTSSIVYPAAAIPQHAARSGAFVVEINLEPTPLTPHAGAFLSGPAAVIVPQLVGGVS